MLPCQFPVVMYRTAPVNHRTLPYKSNQNKSIKSRKWTQEVPPPALIQQVQLCIYIIVFNYTLLEKEKKKERFGTKQHSSLRSKSPRWGSIVFLISQKASSGWPWGLNLHQTVVHTASSVRNCCNVGLLPDWVEHIRVIGCNPLSSGAKYVTDFQRWVRNYLARSPQSNFFKRFPCL